jgi:hypothetical protein
VDLEEALLGDYLDLVVHYGEVGYLLVLPENLVCGGLECLFC